MDIDGWLRRIGLEQYVQTFRDNAIDADVLRDLTDQHLRELGLPLGARLKILRAAAALGALGVQASGFLAFQYSVIVANAIATQLIAREIR